ncbi:MAG: DUF59 domain-containing protein [Bacteroidetes bacterium]|nr:DUF59 domain-containing protein [Bacteroidota bacterium]
MIEKLKEEIKDQIKKVYDPEIPVDVYSLGLIYEINIDSEKNIHILMTLTSPNCPAAETIPAEIESSVKSLKWAKNVTIEITFDPPYDTDMMSEEAKLELGID